MKSATVARRWFPLKNHKFLSLHLMLFNYVLQHNLHCPFHFWLDQTKQKSCIIINVMLGSRTRTQFSICFNQQNSFAPVFMIASNRLYFYFSKVPIMFYSFILCIQCHSKFHHIHALIKYLFFAVLIIGNTPDNKISNVLVEEYDLKSFIYK